MDRTAIKDFMYGGMMEIMRNSKYYYRSSVGVEYSHFTEEGEAVAKEFMSMVAHKALLAEDKELDDRAKKMVIDGLKGTK